jgi:hypothetical protein
MRLASESFKSLVLTAFFQLEHRAAHKLDRFAAIEIKYIEIYFELYVSHMKALSQLYV